MFRRPSAEDYGVFRCRTTGSGSTQNTRRKSLGYSSGFTTTIDTAEPALAWRFASVSLSGMEEGSGSNRNLEKGPPSTSPSRRTPEAPAPRRLNLLLAEDNVPDALLVREA